MKMYLRLLLITIIGCFLSETVLAQGCSMCTKTASELGKKAGEGLNVGIIYLAILPLIFMGTVAYIWYKRNYRSSN